MHSLALQSHPQGHFDSQSLPILTMPETRKTFEDLIGLLYPGITAELSDFEEAKAPHDCCCRHVRSGGESFEGAGSSPKL